MLLFLRTVGSGSTRPAVLLAASRDRMRVTIMGHADALELRQSDGRWILESGSTVEIEAICLASPSRGTFLFDAAGIHTAEHARIA